MSRCLTALPLSVFGMSLNAPRVCRNSFILWSLVWKLKWRLLSLWGGFVYVESVRGTAGRKSETIWSESSCNELCVARQTLSDRLIRPVRERKSLSATAVFWGSTAVLFVNVCVLHSASKVVIWTRKQTVFLVNSNYLCLFFSPGFAGGHHLLLFQWRGKIFSFIFCVQIHTDEIFSLWHLGIEQARFDL